MRRQSTSPREICRLVHSSLPPLPTGCHSHHRLYTLCRQANVMFMEQHSKAEESPQSAPDSFPVIWLSPRFAATLSRALPWHSAQPTRWNPGDCCRREPPKLHTLCRQGSHSRGFRTGPHFTNGVKMRRILHHAHLHLHLRSYAVHRIMLHKERRHSRKSGVEIEYSVKYAHCRNGIDLSKYTIFLLNI